MILNGKMINPADLDTRITLQRCTIINEPGGFKRTSYTTAEEVWAKWTNIHGGEVWQSMAIQADSPATVLIRYYPGLDHTWRIIKDGKPYEIVSPDDIQERHEYIEMKVKAQAGGG